MNAAFLSGEENSDEMSKGSRKVKFSSNQAGGILGGISFRSRNSCFICSKTYIIYFNEQKYGRQKR